MAAVSEARGSLIFFRPCQLALSVGVVRAAGKLAGGPFSHAHVLQLMIERCRRGRTAGFRRGKDGGPRMLAAHVKTGTWRSRPRDRKPASSLEGLETCLQDTRQTQATHVQPILLCRNDKFTLLQGKGDHSPCPWTPTPDGAVCPPTGQSGSALSKRATFFPRDSDTGSGGVCYLRQQPSGCP